jgi:hypothetical protein
VARQGAAYPLSCDEAAVGVDRYGDRRLGHERPQPHPDDSCAEAGGGRRGARRGGGVLSVALAIAGRGPSWRVRRLLTLVRPHVDEIALGGDDETLEACGELADLAVAATTADELAQMCRADWVMCCEPGEVPSRALLEALRGLAGERRLTHYALTHRWLHGDPARFLLGPPWQPGYRPRLARRGERAVRQHRLLDLPVYRSELLLEPEHARRARALVQERLHPERLPAGAPEGALLVPEDWVGLSVGVVPAADRAAVAHLLGADAPPPALGVSPAPAASPEPGATAAAPIAFVRPVTRTRVNVVHEQEVVVRNGGDAPWPWRADGEAPIRLGYRWRAAARPHAVLGEGPRTPFTETVLPGARSRACLRIEAPSRPGRYLLEVDVVEEHVRWLGRAASLEVAVGESAGRGGARAGRRGYVAQARAHGLSPRDALRAYPRWAASRAVEATPLRDGRPWLPFAAQDALERALRPGARVCEYGCGGSTRFALERGADVLTIEWDADWARRVAAAIGSGARAAWTLEVVAPDPDERAAALDPADPAAYVSAAPALSSFSFGAYARAIDRHPGAGFDVVLVAGRARPSCMRHALPRIAPGGLLVLDHSERPWYRPALALCDPGSWARADHRGPGPYAERFWQTTFLRRAA